MKINVNKLILQIESLAILGFLLWLYHISEYSWVMFFILILFPDVSMIAYFKGSKIGAYTYNFFHTLVVPMLLAALGYWMTSPQLFAISLIWLSHISIDRALGLGLKDTSEFKTSHLSKV